VQYHPVSDVPEHVDFLRLVKGEKVHVWIKLKTVNAEKAPGIKRGGALNIVRHEVELICTPENIPAEITVDLTGLEIGHSIHASQVKIPEGTSYAIKDRDFTMVTIVGRMEEEKEEAAPTMSMADVQTTAQGPADPAAAAAAGDAKAAGGDKKAAAPA